MQQVKNKVYREDQGRSFDHLMDENGQFKLKDVAEFLEKSASALANTLIKLADAGQFNVNTYNTDNALKPTKTESQGEGNRGAREFAEGVKNTAVGTATISTPETVNRAAPLYAQNVTNDENKVASDTAVYPQSEINKAANAPEVGSNLMGGMKGADKSPFSGWFERRKWTFDPDMVKTGPVPLKRLTDRGYAMPEFVSKFFSPQQSIFSDPKKLREAAQMKLASATNLSQNNIGTIMDRETVHKILQKRAADACSKVEDAPKQTKETVKLEPYMKKEMPKVASAITREKTREYLTNHNDGSLYKCASDLQKVAIAPIIPAIVAAGKAAIPWITKTAIPAIVHGAKWLGGKALLGGTKALSAAKTGAAALKSGAVAGKALAGKGLAAAGRGAYGFGSKAYGAVASHSPWMQQTLTPYLKNTAMPFMKNKAMPFLWNKALPAYGWYSAGELVQGMKGNAELDQLKQSMDLAEADGFDKTASAQLVKKTASYEDVLKSAEEDAKQRGLVFQPFKKPVMFNAPPLNSPAHKEYEAKNRKELSDVMAAYFNSDPARLQRTIAKLNSRKFDTLGGPPLREMRKPEVRKAEWDKFYAKHPEMLGKFDENGKEIKTAEEIKAKFNPKLDVVSPGVGFLTALAVNPLNPRRKELLAQLQNQQVQKVASALSKSAGLSVR